MLTMRIMPKMSERPPARRKSSAPYEMPLNSWLIQNSNGQATWISTAGARVTAGDCTIGALSPLEVPRETPARAFRLFPDRGPAPMEAPAGGAHRGVDHRERGRVGHREADAPRRALGASGRHDRARRAQLGVARLRDARRLLADARRAREAEDPRDDGDQRERVPRLRARRPRDERCRLGVHGPRREAGRDAPDPRPARCDPDGHPPDVGLHRQETQGMARAW